MSHASPAKDRVTLPVLMRAKEEKRKLVMVTCYDAAFGRLVDSSPVDMVLVGDSLGNVMLGFENTLPVTMEHMLHHTAAVARVMTKPFLIADMPFGSYQVSVAQAVENAVALVRHGGAMAVKLEGGAEMADRVRAIVQVGIPVMAHLGLTPQSIHALGGYRVQGRKDEDRKRLLADAKALQDAGAFSLVLELVPESLAKDVTKSLRIPTIGIGAGADTDGQVLVLHDLLGFNDSFKPKFLKHYANMGDQVQKALSTYAEEVRGGAFPDSEHSFKD